VLLSALVLGLSWKRTEAAGPDFHDPDVIIAVDAAHGPVCRSPAFVGFQMPEQCFDESAASAAST